MERRRNDRPAASSAEVSKRMQGVRRVDTAPELAIRRLLHAAGLRYRVNFAPLEGLRRRADVVFTASRIAVYVDGCFWHGCPIHATWPKSNADFWRAKIEGNRRRDADTDARLIAAGWTVIRVWEHEDPVDASRRIMESFATLRGLGANGGAPTSEPG